MRIACLLAVLALLAPTARADDTADDHIARARAAHDRGDFAHAREELLAAYQLEPRPALLFALGQVALNLGHYKEAIDYYEQFKATNPPADQAALAEQAIGAARLELGRPKPPPHREWDLVDGVIGATGGAALFASGTLFYESSKLAQDRSGSIAAYDERVHHAYVERDVAIGCAIGGAVALGAAALRWRFRLVETTIRVEASPSHAALVLEHRL